MRNQYSTSADPNTRKERHEKDRSRGDHSATRRYPKTSQPSASTQQEQSPQASASTPPVTNQDEQRRTTNAGDSSQPMGEQETEGDSCRYRSKPCLCEIIEHGMPARISPTM